MGGGSRSGGGRVAFLSIPQEQTNGRPCWRVIQRQELSIFRSLFAASRRLASLLLSTKMQGAMLEKAVFAGAVHVVMMFSGRWAFSRQRQSHSWGLTSERNRGHSPGSHTYIHDIFRVLHPFRVANGSDLLLLFVCWRVLLWRVEL